MAKAGLTSDNLRDLLAEIPAVELKGVALLQQYRPQGQILPSLYDPGISREALTEAVAELIEYTNRCGKTTMLLSSLSPIPVTGFSILEYGL